jgi:hypothetical protein
VPNSPPPGRHVPRGAAAARAAFLEWIRGGGTSGRTFLEVWIRPGAPGSFEILHREDGALQQNELQTFRDVFAARTIAQTNARGAHRPLKTAPNLKRGWLLTDLDGKRVCQAMDYLYPACVAHWQGGLSGTLEITDWVATAARQSGMYSAVGLHPPDAVQDLTRACCSEAVCLREVAWGFDGDSRPGVGTPRAEHEARVPCPEACSLFISLARKTLMLEREPRAPVPPIGDRSHAELRQLVAVATAVADGTVSSVREGDFEHPANLRRVRYLVARIEREMQRRNTMDDD